MSSRSTSLSRRSLLRFAASSVLVPLFARDATDARASGEARPLRLVLLMQANGTSQAPQVFWPDAQGQSSSRILEPLFGNARLSSRTTVVKGLFNHAGGFGNEHDRGFAGLWTGRRTIGSFADPWGAGPSIDQMLRSGLIFGGSSLAMKVPFPTLNCGVLALDGSLNKDHRSSFAYFGPRQPVPCEIDPFRLHARMFAPQTSPLEAQQRLAEQRSVLDFASADLRRMSSRLGREEREKLDVHATAMREYEQRLAILAARPQTAACVRKPPPRIDPRVEANVPLLLPAMIDLVALAIACDLVRVVTFPIGNAGLTWRYEWLGIDKDSHGDIAHRDDGKTPEVTEAIVKIGRWHAEHVARLALALDAIPEGHGGGTVLDNTLIVWGNELASGQHTLDDIPIVLVGGAGGRLKSRPKLVDQGPQTYHRLGCTVMNLMGTPARGFGEETDCGMIRGLKVD